MGNKQLTENLPHQYAFYGELDKLKESINTDPQLDLNYVTVKGGTLTGSNHTIFSVACRGGHYNIVEYLYTNHKEIINFTLCNPMLQAFKSQNIQLILYLIEKVGLEFNISN